MQHKLIAFSVRGLIAALCSLGASHAGTWTVKPQAFTVTSKIDAVVVPADPVLVEVETEEWSDLVIEKIIPHGSAVKKGDVLVRFRRDELDRKLEDARRGVKLAKIAADNARTALEAHRAGVEIKLDAVKRAQAQAAEDLAYFKQTKRPAEEEGAKERIKRATYALEAESEELKQLTAMYQADDLTEDTEEFILKRQRDQVAAAEFSLRMQKLATAHTLEVELPREQVALERAATEAKIALDAATAELPRSLEAKTLETEAAEVAAKRAADDLAKLEADAAKLEVKAVGDGFFYHGAFEDGRWITGEATKGLIETGKVFPKRAFATFVPAGAAKRFTAHVDESTALRLKTGMPADAKLTGHETQAAVAAKLESVAARPGTDGRYRVDAAAEIPATVMPGMTAKLHVVVHQAADALVVPRKALRDGPGGSRQVEVQLADGKSERRTIKEGLAEGDEIQILEGLEAGQVVVIPE